MLEQLLDIARLTGRRKELIYSAANRDTNTVVFPDNQAEFSAFVGDSFRRNRKQRIWNPSELIGRSSLYPSSVRKAYVAPSEANEVEIQLVGDPLHLVNLVCMRK